MKITKKNINGYDLFIYNTKRYSSIHLKFLFELPYTRDDIFKCDILEEYMVNTNAKYKTRKSMGERLMELYSMGCRISNYNRGVKLFVEVNFSFYDPELVKDDYLKEALTFAGDMIFEPNFKNEKLDKEELERIKIDFVSSIGEGLLNPKKRASRSFTEAMFPNTFATYDIVKSKKEFEDIINSYNDKDLIDIYHRLIDESLVGATLMGNIKDEYIEYIEEIFKFKSVQKIDRRFKEKLKIDATSGLESIECDATVKDSILRAVYASPSKSLKERVIYSAITRMLSSTGRIIYKILRDEENIVYSAGASYVSRQDYILLYAHLDKKNKDIALDGFERAFEKLKDRDTVRELLKRIKEEDEEFLYVYEENKNNPHDELYDRAFKLRIPDKKWCKIMKEVTEDDIENALEKIKLVKIHFYEGDKE